MLASATPLLDDFEGWVQKFGPQVSEPTATKYRRDVEAFVKQYGHPFHASKETLREWYLGMVDQLAPSTTNRKIAALRALFTYLRDRDIRTDDPMAGISMRSIPKRLPKPVGHEDILTLLRRAREGGNVQDVAIIEVLYGSGIRRAEAARLTLRNVRDRESLRVVGKGNKERLTILTSAAFEAIVELMLDRHSDRLNATVTDAVSRAMEGQEAAKLREMLFWSLQKEVPDAPLFVNERGVPLRDLKDPGHYLWYRIKQYDESGEIRATPHRFRHSFGTELLNGGADLASVQMVMGHSDIRTTQGYTELKSSGLKLVLRAHTRQGDDD